MTLAYDAGVSALTELFQERSDERNRRSLDSALVSGLALESGIADDGIACPPDSGVIDVTKPPYSVVPDDKVNETAAIQQLQRPTTQQQSFESWPGIGATISDQSVCP